MGTGIEEESKMATTNAPQIPILARAGSRTNFHLAAKCAKNDFKPLPLPAGKPSLGQIPLYGPENAFEGHQR